METAIVWQLYSSFLTIVILFTIAGNSLVCILITRNRALKSSINWLLFHLAIADLLVAVFFIPPCVLSHFIHHPGGKTGNILCLIFTAGTLGWISASASSFLLVSVAFERYYATLHPFRSLQRRYSWWLLFLLWILAISLNLPSIVVTAFDVQSQMCSENFPSYTFSRAYYITWSFCNSVIPICIMGYLYSSIILHLQKQTFIPDSSRVSATRRRNKVTKMLISVTVIFAVCWIPQATLCVISPIIPGGYGTVSAVATASALLNSCLNPLMYTLHSQQFRKNLASLISNWIPQKSSQRPFTAGERARTDLLRKTPITASKASCNYG